MTAGWRLPKKVGPFTVCMTKPMKDGRIDVMIASHIPKRIECTGCTVRPTGRRGYVLTAYVGYCDSSNGGAQVVLQGTGSRVEMLMDSIGTDNDAKIRALRSCNAIIRAVLLDGEPLRGYLNKQFGFSEFADKAVKHMRTHVPRMPEPYNTALGI